MERVTICVPDPDDGDNVVAETVATELAHEYGGSTKVDASGYWDDGGFLVPDDSTLVWTVADDPDRERVREIAEWVRDELQEDAVMVTYQEVEAEFV